MLPAELPNRSFEPFPRSVLLALPILLLFAGFLFVLQPLPIMALIGGAGFVLMCLIRPIWALGAFLFAHIVFPAYIRVPPSVPPTIGMLVVLAGTAALATVLGQHGRPLGPQGRRFVVILVLFGVAALGSMIDPRTTGDSLGMWIKAFVLPGFVIWIIVRTLNDETDIDHMFQVMLVAACATALYGIYEYHVGSNLLYDRFMSEEVAERAMYRTDDVLGPAVAYRSFSVSSQPIEFGTWLSMLLPYALIRFARCRSLARKALFAAACIVLVLGVAVTFSRGCLLAVAITCVSLGIIVRPLRAWLFAGLVGSALALLVAWPLIADKVADRASDVDNVTLRFKLWQTALGIFQDHPLVGAGFGNFPQYQMDAVRAHRIGPFYEFDQDSTGLIGVAESTYFQMAAETGVVGLVTFVAVMVAFFAFIARLARGAASLQRRDIALCIGAAALAYLINGLTITAYTHYITTLLLAGVMFGFLLVLLRAEQDSPSLAPDEAGRFSILGRIS